MQLENTDKAEKSFFAHSSHKVYEAELVNVIYARSCSVWSGPRRALEHRQLVYISAE